MAPRQQNYRAKRQDAGRLRTLVYILCTLILILCVWLDIVFVKGLFF